VVAYTPWIALVSCDANATNASQAVDIFTLARDAGAKSALLYSIHSKECIIDPEYADPANFDQVMDIFSTQSLTSATLIEYQFGQFGAMNESIYGSFNAQKLNQSGNVINSTIETNTPLAPGYLFATLTAYNATGPGTNDTDNNTNTNVTSNGNTGGSPNTGLAMIILYAITGCVSALFCIVIISGAVRAIRHPERYGPRAARHMDGGIGMGQSRARGLTRAILDTFPVVKFGGSDLERRPSKDVESGPDSGGPRDSTMEMKDWQVVDVPIDMTGHAGGEEDEHSVTYHTPTGLGDAAEMDGGDVEDSQPRASGSRMAAPIVTSSPSAVAGQLVASRTPDISGKSKDVVPAAIGRETCPICIVDFEEGDDLRLLPCEGKHRFHQECVDPWLLELSSSCPICRQDFQALETMLSGDMDDASYSPQAAEHPSTLPIHSDTRGSGSPTQSQGNRFSRYLRFARRRRNRTDEDSNDVQEREYSHRDTDTPSRHSLEDNPV
jgi:hypothetical protein